MPVKDYMDHRSLLPAMRKFVDSFKHFIKLVQFVLREKQENTRLLYLF